MKKDLEKLGNILGFPVIVFCFATILAGLFATLGLGPNWTIAIAVGTVLTALFLIFAKKLEGKPLPAGVLQRIGIGVSFLAVTTFSSYGIDLMFNPKRATLERATSAPVGLALAALVFWIFQRLRARRSPVT